MIYIYTYTLWRSQCINFHFPCSVFYHNFFYSFVPLQLTIIGVWSLSAIYSSPKLIFSDIHLHSFGGIEEILCIPVRTSYDSKTYDMMNMVFLFILPLAVITILYTRIGIVLWTSSRGQMSATTTVSTTGGAGENYQVADDANEPSTSSSNGVDGVIPADGSGKKQASCMEILCFGCNSSSPRFAKCCCKILRRSSPSPTTPQKLNIISHANGTNDIENNSPQNYYCPTSNNAPSNYQHENVNNTRNSTGIVEKPNSILKNSKAYSCSNSSTSSSSSSSLAHGNNDHKISSTEPIVVVKFDNPSDSKRKKNGQKKNSRARCTILMKTSTEQSQAESPLLENGGLQHHFNENHEVANCSTSNESPIVPNKRTNSVVWNDNKNAEYTAASNRNYTARYNNNNSCSTNGSNNNRRLTPNAVSLAPPTQANNNNRFRRMRIIRCCTYGSRALKSRRRVIRMLVVIVFVFALCNFPFHARKIWQYWGKSYTGGSTFSNLFTPITFLIMYMNSAINPILYAFMSKKFRLSFRDLLTCRMRRSLHFARTASVRSTHVVPLSTAVP